MTIIHEGLAHYKGHVMAAVDLETTGKQPGHHEVCQIAILPLDNDLRPSKTVRPFVSYVRPESPSRADMAAMRVNGLSVSRLMETAPPSGRVQEMLIEWFDKLELPYQRRIIPLAHNWAFESSFLNAWLGAPLFEQMFQGHARDAMILANCLNDRASMAGRAVPFPEVGLTALCSTLKVNNEHAHDAMSDCVAEAAVYRNMIVGAFL